MLFPLSLTSRGMATRGSSLRGEFLDCLSPSFLGRMGLLGGIECLYLFGYSYSISLAQMDRRLVCKEYYLILSLFLLFLSDYYLLLTVYCQLFTAHDFPFGDYIRGDTPLPIPNRAVKPSRADDTSPVRSGKVGRRQGFFF